MADNSGNRKKTLIVSVLAFLFIGGGVFLFFIIQGSDDITGAGRKNNFAYGFSVRDAVLPLFKRLGISTYEDEIVVATKKRLEARGIDLSPETSAPADVSDWMANSAGGAPSASGASPRAGATAVPRMTGAGSLGGGSGGGTKSEGGVSRFGDGAASGNTKISAGMQSRAAGPAGKGTLGALKNARAILGEGLRSDSAMTASSKWGQSFGVGGSASGKSGDLAYAKTGLVSLDKIKSGEISSLKMDSKGSLKTTDVSSPVKDAEGTAKALAGDKKAKEDMDAKMKADMAQQAIQAAADAATKPGEKPAGNDARDPPKPPEEVANIANNKEPPDGKFCPGGCQMAGGGSYKDNDPDVKKDGSTWTVTYSGTQTNADGSTFPYTDTMVIIPGRTPPLVPFQSTANGKPVDFGSGP